MVVTQRSGRAAVPGTTRDSELLLPAYVHCLASLVFPGPPKCLTKQRDCLGDLTKMRQVAVVTWLLALAAPSTGGLVPGCREVELQLEQECRQEQARPRLV